MIKPLTCLSNLHVRIITIESVDFISRDGTDTPNMHVIHYKYIVSKTDN